MHSISGEITPLAPFDFARARDFLGGFTPTRGEQRVTEDSITKAVSVHGQAVAFALRNVGTVDAPRVAYAIHAARALTASEQALVSDRIGFFLSMMDDLGPFYALGQADARFAPVITRLYGLHQPKFLTPFEIASWAILAQRTPLPVAHQTKLALIERFGASITLPEGTFRAFPEATGLLAVDPGELESVVRNERKSGYLRAVTEAFASVDEAWLRGGDYDEVAAWLRGIRGIGEWSSHFILIRGLGRMDRVPTVDGELTKAAGKVYGVGRPFTADEVAEKLAHYGAFQGYWAYYCRAASA
ncbi:MAG TPA: hypothetical protein VF807_04050 [Ktedonobacterales bacterium]